MRIKYLQLLPPLKDFMAVLATIKSLFVTAFYRDEGLTISLLMKYLVKKLGLEDESEVSEKSMSSLILCCNFVCLDGKCMILGCRITLAMI